MELVKQNEKKSIVVARCENCGREMNIPYANTINPHKASIDLKSVVRCECGEYHNLIVGQESHPTISTSPSHRPPKTSYEDDAINCPRCGSTQLHAGDKGFSLGKAAAGGILIGAAGLLGGLLGSKKTIITCLKCGYKWQAGKQ